MGRPIGSKKTPQRHFGKQPPPRKIPKARIAVQLYEDGKYAAAFSLFVHFLPGDDLEKEMRVLEDVLTEALAGYYGRLEDE